MKRSFLIIISIISFLFTGCFAYMEATENEEKTDSYIHVDWNDSYGTYYYDLSYGDSSYNKYDLYVPKNISETNPNAKHLIMMIHGGAWMGGSKKSERDWCEYYTVKGYTTATVNYTLYENDSVTNIDLINEEMKVCVRNIKETCAEKGIQLVDMAVYGFSAGGCQALLYGFKEKDTSALPVKFIFEQSGPSSFNPDIWTKKQGLIDYVIQQTENDETTKGRAKFISKFTGKNVTEEMVKNGDAEIFWKEISPYYYINKDSVPCIFAYGALDGIVPPVSSKILVDALKKNKVHYDFVDMKNSGHQLSYDYELQKEFVRLANIYCDTYFR